MKNKTDGSERLAEKINYLFETYRKPDGERYNYLEVERLTGGKIDNSWLSKMASGKVSRPGLTVLRAITDFFCITPDFWFKDLDEWIQEQAHNGQDTELREQVATRANSLPEEARQIIFDLVESFEKRFGKKK